MINKRLLHFLSFVYFTRSAGEKMIHALIRQQMLHHFYNMFTLLLTLHTATTATLLLISLYPNNTKQSICNTFTTNTSKSYHFYIVCMYHMISQLGLYC